MSIRRRLSKLEKGLDAAKSKRHTIACISSDGLSDEEVKLKIEEAKKDYRLKHGSMDKLILFITHMPEPDPPPDENDPGTMRISGT